MAHEAAASRTHTLASLPQQKKSPPLVLTHFAIADIHEAANLMRIASHVRGLALSSDQYTARPARPFRWCLLQTFTALERLEIDHGWDRPLDVKVITPQLRTLVIKRARNVINGLVGLTKLCVLHLEDTNIESFAFAVGLPSLQSLTLLMSPHKYNWFCDVASLAEIAPLTRLVVRGVWEHCPRAAMGPHVETLHEYIELDTTVFSPLDRDVHPEWFTLVHLRTLRMGRFAQTDLKAIMALVALEELQVVVAMTVQSCRPLRRLVRLRELHLTNGFMCDLVGFLPRLETLVWEYHYIGSYDDRRGTLYRRGSRRGNGNSSGDVSSLRKLVLHGSVSIDPYVGRVHGMLKNVEHVEVHGRYRGEFDLEEIAQLCHLTRLAIVGVRLPVVPRGRKRRFTFASAASLEELYYRPYCCNSQYTEKLTAPFPLWFHDRLPNLRVLASPFQESLVDLARICPRLTHLHIPFSMNCGFPEASRESLSRLCAVTLGACYDCTWLRSECGPGRALPSLCRIFHPTTDCLTSSPCARRRIVVGREGIYKVMFVAERALVPMWSQKWENLDGYDVDEEEYYHRVVPDEGPRDGR
jgi:hypothetical protein